MKYSNLRTVLSLSVVALIFVLMTVYGSSTQAIATGPEEAASGQAKPLSVSAENTTENKAPAAPYKAGTLLKGSNHALYYVTETGTRQLIYDAATFSAFGFQPEEVIKVDDDALAAMPMTDVLTRLVLDDEDNLYWVVNGQRWQVNAWQDMVNQPTYKGGIIGHLDSFLKETLPVRVGLKNRTFLRQNEAVYYFSQYSIFPLAGDGDDEAEIIDVPPDVLAIYPRQTSLETLWTELKDSPAAYVRSGPGKDFDIINTIYQTDTIIVKGRAKNSYWLPIEYQGQIGWLAGDLVKYQSLFKFLPTFDTSALKPEKHHQQSNNSNIYEGVGGYMSTSRDGIPLFSEVMKGYPAHMAGIKQGDVVMKIDGEDATTLSVSEAVMQIRGPKGVEVVLTIFRPETNETLEFAIIRDVINPDTATYVCGVEPIRGFGNAWREHPEIQDPLGCPYTNFRRDEHATHAAVQRFEHGWMLWLETDTVANVDPIYVFYEDDGSFLRYGDRELVDAHGYAPTPLGFYKVGDRFAKVYWEEIGADGRQRLGQAINEAKDSLGAFQEFRNGRMFWAGEADTIYVIYSGYLDLDGDGRISWTQAWTSFEDTFEDTPED